MKLKTNENIQYLRGIAALLVVMAHTVSSFTTYKDIGGIANIILVNLELLGQVGVGVFFIISGYIMSMTTNNKRGGSLSARQFMLKRLVRIYPIYFIWTSVLLILWWFGFILKSHNFSITKIITSYLLIPYSSFEGEAIDPVLRQGWTLIYEAFYYICFAGLIFIDKFRKIGVYTLLVFFILLNILSMLMIYPAAQSFFGSHVIFLFLIGMFIFHHQEDIIRRIKTHSVRSIFLVIFSLLVLLIALKDSALGNYAQYLHYLAAIILFLYLFTAHKVSGIVLKIGNSSYSLYLTHTFLTLGYAVIVRSGRFSNVTLFALGILTFFIAIVVGEIAYRLIERKIIYKTAAVAHVSPPLVKP